jgi:putative ABC transport system permease protein
MLAIVLSNLLRRPARTVFTALGIALGIAMIVALLSFSRGLQKTAAGFVHLGGSGLGVFQSGVSEPTASLLPESLVGRLERERDVARATPLLLIVEGVRREPAAIVFGADPHGFFAGGLVLVEGTRGARGGILVGDELASRMHLRPGAALSVHGRTFAVEGIYHSGILFEDAGAVLPLSAAQALAGRPHEATDIVVALRPGVRAAAAGHRIEHAFAGTQVITDPEQALRVGANSTLISKAILVLAVIAIVLGALSVANTMAMSVIERQREIGLLSTVGWSSPRIASLILGEGVAVSVLGAAVGLLVGVIGSHLLVNALGVSAYISPSITAWGLGRGLLVGVAIGVLGGIYPAWRVTRMPPLRALSGT